MDERYHDELCRIGFYNLGPKIKLQTLLPDENLALKFGWITKKTVGFVLRRSKRKNPENSFEIFEFFALKSYNKLYSQEISSLQFVYIFENGSIIYWNFTEEEETKINKSIEVKLGREIQSFCNEYYYLEKNAYEDDPELFIKEHIQHNLIFMKTFSNEEKMAYSFALSFSVKLQETEDKLNGIIDSINAESNFDISKILYNFQRRQHFRRLCSLYLIRTESNFDFKILEENFYSSANDEFIPMYKQMYIYTNISNSQLKRNGNCRVSI